MCCNSECHHAELICLKAYAVILTVVIHRVDKFNGIMLYAVILSVIMQRVDILNGITLNAVIMGVTMLRVNELWVSSCWESWSPKTNLGNCIFLPGDRDVWCGAKWRSFLLWKGVTFLIKFYIIGIMINVIRLYAIILSVFMLRVAAPKTNLDNCIFPPGDREVWCGAKWRLTWCSFGNEDTWNNCPSSQFRPRRSRTSSSTF